MDVLGGVEHLDVVELVGSGAFSTVWRARDHRLDCDVAVKVLAENHALNPEVRSRFVDEGRMLRKAGHQFIPALYEIGETSTDQPYLVMEFAAGGELKVRGEPGSGEHVAQLVAVVDLLEGALAAMHSRGLVHRDVKPQNILEVVDGVRGEGSPSSRYVLGDLGFAKDLEAASGYTVGGGTPWFQAPEQTEAISYVDARADVYSASAVLAWLMTGSVPRSGDWFSQLDSAGVDSGLRDAIAAGLAVDAADRPGTIGVWADRVRQALVADPVGASEMAVVSQSGGVGRRAVVAAVVGLVAVVVGGCVGWLIGQSDGSDRVVTDGVVVVREGLVVVSGPATLRVGEPGTYIVSESPEGAALLWIDESGATLDAAEPLVIEAGRVGDARVSLVGIVDREPVALDVLVEIVP